jgi:hypothetical protein
MSPATPGRTAPHVLQHVSTSRTPCKRTQTLSNLKRQRPTSPCTTASRRPTRSCYPATKLTPSTTRNTSDDCTRRTGLVRPHEATGSTLTNFKHPRHPYRALSWCCAIRHRAFTLEESCRSPTRPCYPSCCWASPPTRTQHWSSI